jgi:hypothetical protein
LPGSLMASPASTPVNRRRPRQLRLKHRCKHPIPAIGKATGFKARRIRPPEILSQSHRSEGFRPGDGRHRLDSVLVMF